MPHLRAYLEQLGHRHQWRPMRSCAAEGIELERCDCGAVRPVQRPEAD